MPLTNGAPGSDQSTANYCTDSAKAPLWRCSSAADAAVFASMSRPVERQLGLGRPPDIRHALVATCPTVNWGWCMPLPCSQVDWRLLIWRTVQGLSNRHGPNSCSLGHCCWLCLIDRLSSKSLLLSLNAGICSICMV